MESSQGMVVMSQPAGPPPQLVSSPAAPASARRAWFRRPALSIALVLMVIAGSAAAVFLAVRPGTITARGTVIDGRTGRPVALASVHAGGRSATTNARGVFQIPGLALHAAVSVRARYYTPARSRVTGAPLRIRLAPVPVLVTVTSGLSGDPLPALVSPPKGPPVTTFDGAATVYLAGPGQALTVRAVGYRPARAVISPDHTATATLRPTRRTMRTKPWARLWAWADGRKYRAIAAWVLRPAIGFALMPGTGHNQGSGGDPQIAHITSGYIDSVSVSVSVFTAKRGAHWDPPVTPAIDTGASSHPVTLAGHRAWHGGPDRNRLFDTMWSYDPVFIITTGPSQASADTVMTNIIKAIAGHGH
jgi:hypothetical protein